MPHRPLIRATPDGANAHDSARRGGLWSTACYGRRVVRKLEHYLADEAKSEGDDRILISRTEERKEKQRVEAKLFELATKLTQLKKPQLARLELPEHYGLLFEEIRGIHDPAALNRAIKRLRAELRSFDLDELAQSIAALTDPQAPRAPDAAAVFCDRLSAGGDAALAEFVTQFPAADRAQLRSLLRNCAKAKEPERKRARERLTQAVRQAMQRSSAKLAETSEPQAPHQTTDPSEADSETPTE